MVNKDKKIKQHISIIYWQGFIQRGALGSPPSIFQMLLCNNIVKLGALD